jgi:hypothetical protein
MTSFSSPSSPVSSIFIPEIPEINCNFVYNYYVYDESTNSTAGIPESFKSTVVYDTNSVRTTNASLRIPRYVSLNWRVPAASSEYFSNSSNNFSIADNLDKIATEDTFSFSKFITHTYSTLAKVEIAKNVINNDISFGSSQAGHINDYVSYLLSNYSQTGDETSSIGINQQITEAVSSIEKIADQPKDTLGINFYDNKGNQMSDVSGFDSIKKLNLHSQINSLVLSDLFISSKLSSADTKTMNQNQQNKKNNNVNNNFSIVSPVNITPVSDNSSVEAKIIGYLIEKYELTNSGTKKLENITIEDPRVTSVVDLKIKYGSTYFYMVRTVLALTTPGNPVGTDGKSSIVQNITYLIASRPTITSINCAEQVAPPPPTDLGFVYDYNNNNLNIVWNFPSNSQRDIKQFQIFRRSSINEPFELLQQQHFDYSTKKYLTGELIDGNDVNMTSDYKRYVDFQKFAKRSYIDPDFKIDIDAMKAPKYIYALASVDTHGFISNYSSQFEITFDFFKNKLVKKVISPLGAPRQYPNMYLKLDAFKDVIKTSGEFSKKMKVYFMPEYLKIRYDNQNIASITKNTVETKQDNSFYKIQFINLQNQKSESVKITIDDPQQLMKTSYNNKY